MMLAFNTLHTLNPYLTLFGLLGEELYIKSTGFFVILMERLKKIFTREISIKDSMSNFINTLPPITPETSIKYTEILSKIADLEHSKKGQEKNRPYEVNLEDRTTSKQEENPLYVPYGSDSGYGSLSDEDHGYEDILNFIVINILIYIY